MTTRDRAELVAVRREIENLRGIADGLAGRLNAGCVRPSSQSDSIPRPRVMLLRAVIALRWGQLQDAQDALATLVE